MFSIGRYFVFLVCLLGPGMAMSADIHRELEDIANRLATKIEESQRTNVAVADFTDLDGMVTQLGRFISEEVSTNMVLSARAFSVIDRNHLRTILKEQKLSMSGLMDPENQKKLGKILGVDALVLGSITPFGESYRITFKVVATDTARVVTADRGMLPKTPATDELWEVYVSENLSEDGPSATSPKYVRGPATSGGSFTAGNVIITIDNVFAESDGKYRVVGTAINKGDDSVKVMFLARTELMDQMGYLAEAKSSTGILSCGRDFSTENADWCNKYRAGDYVVLLSNSPQRFAMIFHMSGDQKSLGAQAQLAGRILLHADKAEPYRFNFPALKLPSPSK